MVLWCIKQIEGGLDNKQIFDNFVSSAAYNNKVADETIKRNIRRTREFVELYAKYKLHEHENILPEQINFTESFELLGDGTHRSHKLIELNETSEKDPNCLLEAHGYNPKTWQLRSSKNKKWNTYSPTHSAMFHPFR